MEELAPESRVRSAVDRVADDREADRREMDADLVRPASLQVDREERVLAEQLEQLEVRDGVARAVRVQRLPGRVAAVAADRRLDPAGARSRPAADEGQVGPLELAALDQLLQPLVRLLRAGDDEQARGVAVEPVDDPRSLLVAPPAAPCASTPWTSVPVW